MVISQLDVGPCRHRENGCEPQADPEVPMHGLTLNSWHGGLRGNQGQRYSLYAVFSHLAPQLCKLGKEKHYGWL